MQTSMRIKETAHQLIESLPEDVSWDKVLYTLQVRRDIETGIAEADSDKLYTTSEVMKELGVEE